MSLAIDLAIVAAITFPAGGAIGAVVGYRLGRRLERRKAAAAMRSVLTFYEAAIRHVMTPEIPP